MNALTGFAVYLLIGVILAGICYVLIRINPDILDEFGVSMNTMMTCVSFCILIWPVPIGMGIYLKLKGYE